MKNVLCIGLVMIFLSVLAGAVFAGSGPEKVEELLKNRIERVLQVLEQKDLSRQKKRAKVEAIVDPLFNYALMARLSLGPGHWGSLSPQQRKTFSELFIKRLKSSYFDKISMYSGDSDADFSYMPARVKDGKVRVPVDVLAQDNKINIVYKFYRPDGEWKIYDVEVNGVSIIQSYRSQFNQILSHGSIQDLLDDLRDSSENAR